MSWTNTKSIKDHYIKFKLAIGCFSWCKCFYMMSNFVDWENIIHFGNFFGSIGKKTYFLALGTTPVKGVGFYGSRFHRGKNHCNITCALLYACITELNMIFSLKLQ